MSKDTIEKVLDFGGEGQILQLLHANAYTPECYRKFLAPFTSDYQVKALRQRPLWPNQPASQLKHWSLFANDLIEMMDQAEHKDVIGIGHSLGGIATWLASIKRPDLFSQIILIDPVILPETMVKATKLMPFWLQKKNVPIVKIASNRRDNWPDRQAVIEHLGAKKVFKRLDTQVFKDFVEFGIVDRDDHVTLAYPREWEARVYGTAPNLWKIMPQTTVPIHIIKAEFSDVITESTWQKTQEKTKDATFYEMKKVGHLMPFEKPIELSGYIADFLKNA